MIEDEQAQESPAPSPPRATFEKDRLPRIVVICGAILAVGLLLIGSMIMLDTLSRLEASPPPLSPEHERFFQQTPAR